MVRITAIIIVLNGEAYLKEAIESVLGQTFEDWELLVVDDGSSDGTLSIARSYAQSDKRIRILQHEDRRTHGMSATRNLGLHEAAGEYVAFLDADDVWLPQKLSEQAEILDQNASAAMVYGHTLVWNDWPGSAGGDDFFYGLGVPPNTIYAPPRLFLQLVENVHQTPTTCNAMIRREAALEVGGFDASFRDMFEDQVFFAKLLAVYPVYVSDQCWAKYRQHGASASSASVQADVEREHLRYLRVLRAFLIERGRRFSSERLMLEKKIGKIAASRLRSRARRSLRA
jgi:glycosyltransferase involved in cell wall biosynthesis